MTRRGAPPSGPPSGIVTLLTDFGLDDAYVGVVKGAILGIHPGARLVDLTHGVPPQDVRHGALVLTDAYQVFPPGTVHLAVVDPGVGTRRRALALRADGHYFVGPDNGLLGFCATLPGLTAVALENPRYHRQPTSRTFHARDVFAPAAAHLARGLPLARLGPPLTALRRLDAPPGPRRLRSRLRGRVLLTDRFGNLLTDLRGDALPDAPEACILAVGRARVVGLSETYADCPRGALGALVDSSGRIEVFVREGSARVRLGVGPGALVSLWSSRSRSRRGRPSTRSTSRSRSRRVPPSTRSASPMRSRVSTPPRVRTPSFPTPAPSSAPRRGSPSRATRRP